MKKETTTCPIARAASILGSRWTVLILRELLAHDTRRFQDLLESLEGIAPNTLSGRLKMLEESGVIRRELYEDRPPRARYVLTEKGRKMETILRAMRRWGAEHA